MPKRPLVADPNKLILGTTLGKELMYADTLQEYFGEWHRYTNGAIYSGPEYNPKSSKELIQFIEPLQDEANKKYLEISRKLFTNYSPPSQYFTIVAAEDYEVGFKTRYFAQKVNEPYKVWELDFDTFNSFNRFNQPGINENMYKRDKIQWRLTGTPEYILNWNSNAIQELEITMPKIGTYLLTDPLEFANIEYKGPIDGRFTAGGQFITSAGQNYVGLYHIRKDGGIYEGPTRISSIDRKLFPVTP